MARVFIGVGHGGSDPGAVKYVKEAEANLNIALELKRILEEAGITVGISRTKDENDPLTEEINEANAFKPDLAIDVHNNAGGGDGFEAFVQTNQFAKDSRHAAECIEKHIKAMGQNSRGIKTQVNSYGKDWFGFNREVNAPAIIVEGFFVDHAKDSADFDTVEEQKKLAQAYAKGIMEHLGIEEPKEADVLYRVQVGAFREKANAEAFVRQLEKDGYHAFVVTVGDEKQAKQSQSVAPANKSVGGGVSEPEKRIEVARSFSNAYARTWLVNANNLNMRLGAGTNKEVIKNLKKGERFTCFGYFNDVNGTHWLCGVDSVGTVGYCLKAYLK